MKDRSLLLISLIIFFMLDHHHSLFIMVILISTLRQDQVYKNSRRTIAYSMTSTNLKRNVKENCYKLVEYPPNFKKRKFTGGQGSGYAGYNQRELQEEKIYR